MYNGVSKKKGHKQSKNFKDFKNLQLIFPFCSDDDAESNVKSYIYLENLHHYQYELFIKKKRLIIVKAKSTVGA